MRMDKLTRILGVLRADVVVAGVQDVLVHEGGAGGDLSEERDLDRLADLDSLTLLHEDLACVLASILAIQRRHTVLLGVVTLLERLKCSHEVMTTGDTVCDNAFCDTSGDGTLDNGSDRVHWADDLGLELRRYVKLDLLEEVFGGTETTDDKDVL